MGQQAATPGVWREVSAMFLVSGTCIGGGMLALPVASAAVGYWPSLLIMFFTCLVMILSGLLYFEATLWFKPGAHLITLSSELLGTAGKRICWITFLFIGYASLIGYAAAGGRLVEAVIGVADPTLVQSLAAAASFSLPLLVCVIVGKRTSGTVNTLLFAAMVAFYVILIAVGSSSIRLESLGHSSWNARGLLTLVPVMLTMFSIPGLVPTLAPYLSRNVGSMRRVVTGGLAITFIVYLLWQTMVMGTVPTSGPNSLGEAYATGELSSCVFRCHLSSKTLGVLSDGFAGFALATSFIGISLALMDFLVDGIGWSPTTARRWLLGAIIFIPVVSLGIFIERAFIVMMELTGSIGDGIISLMLPAAMVFTGRYIARQSGPYRLTGGKVVLGLLFLLGALIIGFELIGWV